MNDNGKPKRAKFRLGSSVAVREPKRFVPDATCIIGDVESFELRDDGYWYWLANKGHPATNAYQWFHERDLMLRGGTPINTMTKGQFEEIGLSWGYN